VLFIYLSTSVVSVSPLTPLILTRSGPSSDNLMVSTALLGDIGIRVRAPPISIEQLGLVTVSRR